MRSISLQRIRSLGVKAAVVGVAGTAMMTVGVLPAGAADAKVKGVKVNDGSQKVVGQFVSTSGDLCIDANFDTPNGKMDNNYRVVIERKEADGKWKEVRYTATWSANGTGSSGSFDRECFDKEIRKGSSYRVSVRNRGPWGYMIQGWVRYYNVGDK